MINRRGLITGLISLAAAPAIVRASSLMPVKVIEPAFKIYPYQEEFLRRIEEYVVTEMVKLDVTYGGVLITPDLKIQAISDYEFYKGSQWKR